MPWNWTNVALEPGPTGVRCPLLYAHAHYLNYMWAISAKNREGNGEGLGSKTKTNVRKPFRTREILAHSQSFSLRTAKLTCEF